MVSLMKLLDNNQWVERQFGNCDLGDRRRTERLLTIATNMIASPEASLPQQNVDWSDLKAAYRFFATPAVTFDAVAEQHWQQTRLTKPGRYLLISDTTDIDHTSHVAIRGLGILGDGVGRGVQLHSCLLYDSHNGQIHGTAGALLYYRKFKPVNESRTERLARPRESDLWGNLVDRVGSPPEGCQWIHVFDRGGDNFESMCHIRLAKCDWIIRGSRLNRTVLNENKQPVVFEEALKTARPLGNYELNLRARPGVAARTAKISVSVVKVTFVAPKLHSQWVKECGIKSLDMNVVVVREMDAPKGVTPIVWVLLTSLPVDTFKDAWQIISDYECRWLIEEYHKVIKSACSVEEHALREAQRHEPLIGLISVLGSRLLQMKLVGRNQPDAKAASHVPASWLKCLLLIRPKLKSTGLTVYAFIRELAKLGGFLGRKHDGEPGWQSIWRGFQKMQMMLEGIKLVGGI
jgi:Transposase DNA-binding/Transposase Tn5 dimerisation domain